MARVTVEDCLKRIPNRFFLVHAAAKRVRQLREGSERLIEASDNEDIVTALREIAAGKVFVTRHYTEYEDLISEEDLEESMAESTAENAGDASETAPEPPAEGGNADEGPEEEDQ